MADHHVEGRETGHDTPAPSARDGSVNTQRTTRTTRSSRNFTAHGARQQTNNTPLEDRPQYSLAGNNGGVQREPHYVDREYYDLNPNYQKPKDQPVWGLAKPLPRVVRPGMRRGKQGVVEDKDAENAEPGSSEVIPQLGMIDDQKKGQPKKKPNRLGRNEEDRGYGHQQQERGRRQSYRSHRQDSENFILDHNGTPLAERDNPMDDWRSPQDDGEGDLGRQNTNRLSDVEEHPSGSTLTPHSTTQSADFANDENDDELDLERGDKVEDDEWSLTSEEAEQYIREEKDNHNALAAIRDRFREPLAECLATMIAVLIGIATNLAVQTSADTSGNYQSTNWAWGLGITIGIYIAGGISGAHLNPAVSLMLCISRGFPIRKAFIYILAQVLGGFLAGLIAYGIYKDAIASYNATGGILGNGQPSASFFNEFVATAILACTILALGDDSNAPPGAGMHALIVGLVVTVLTMAFGYTTGACLNPARDFGPRLATAAVGYGSEVFTVSNAWWIYGAWGATITGALIGGLFYDVAIFVGGESPVNYPRKRRKQIAKNAKGKAEKGWWVFKRDVEMGLKGEFGKEG
ncbi:MIP family channel protein [Botrytis cinerea]